MSQRMGSTAFKKWQACVRGCLSGLFVIMQTRGGYKATVLLKLGTEATQQGINNRRPWVKMGSAMTHTMPAPAAWGVALV